MGVHYRPVLQARQGELAALADLAPSVWPGLTPILELVGDEDRPVRAQCTAVRDRLRDSWQDGMRLAVDAGGVAADRSLVHGGDVLLELWTEVRAVLAEVIPVVGPADWRSVPGLRAAGALGRGMVLRPRPAELRLPIDAFDLAVRTVLALSGLDRGDVDLVADLAAEPVDAADLPGSLAPLLSDRSWRSRTLLCGAFPPDLTGVPAMEIHEVPRRDLHTWRAVRAALGPAGRDLDFGDYAVAHPVPGPRGPYRPAPQLRYAVEDRWLVMKGRRGPRTQFYDICRRIGAHSEFASGLGKADALIEERARQGPRSRLGCGSPSTWRELSTAHHLEFVVREIGGGDYN